MAKKRAIQSLKEGEHVVFKVNPYGDQEYTMEGSVIFVDDKHKVVCVCYLFGYQSLSDDIPYDKMVKVYNDKSHPLSGGVSMLMDEEELKKEQALIEQKINEIVDECTISGVLEEASKVIPDDKWEAFLDACIARGDA